MRAIDECAQALQSSEGARWTLRVGAEGWLASEKPAFGPGGELARLLYSLDVVALELASSLDATRLNLLWGVLARARGESWRGAALEGEVHACVGDLAALVPLCTGAFTLVEGSDGAASAGGISPARATSWSDITEVMLNSDADADGGNSERKLASLLAGATSHAALAPKMAGVGERLAVMSEPDRDAMSSRIAKWMGTLPSETRDALLTMDQQTSAGMGKLLHALAGKLPIEQIVGALEKHTDADASLNARHNLLLFAKLSNLAMDQSVDLQRRVLSAMQRLGGRNGPKADTGRQTLSAVELLLQPNHADDFTPDEYRERLQSLSQHMLHAASRTKDPEELTKDRLRVRVGEIGAHLVASESSEPPSAGIITSIMQAVKPSLGMGSLDAFISAAGVVSSWSERLANAESVRALQGLREYLLWSEVLFPALQLAGLKHNERSKLLDAVGAMDPRSVPAVVKFLAVRRRGASQTEAEWLDTIERWIERVPTDWSSDQLVGAVREGVVQHRTLLGVWKRASGAVQATAMEQLVRATDDAVRRRVYAVLDALEGRWTGGRIRDAILDADPEIASRGEARLARDASVAELCGMLRSLAITVSADEARLALAVAHVLERCPSDEEVRKTLKMWRYSPARLRAGMMRRRSSPAPKGAAA